MSNLFVSYSNNTENSIFDNIAQNSQVINSYTDQSANEVFNLVLYNSQKYIIRTNNNIQNIILGDQLYAVSIKPLEDNIQIVNNLKASGYNAYLPFPDTCHYIIYLSIPSISSISEFFSVTEYVNSSFGDLKFYSDGVTQAALVPNDTLYPQQWYLNTVNAASAWDITTGSNNVTVAVLDTGVSTASSTGLDIKPKLVPGASFVTGQSSTYDDVSHGTQCAHLIAAVTNNSDGMAGIGWNVNIAPVKVMQLNPSTGQGTGQWSWTTAGILWAADNNCDVLSLSLGGSISTPTDGGVISAIDYAISRNCVVVVAAGNSGPGGNNPPANCSPVISVGATTSSNTVASFSSYQDGSLGGRNNNPMTVCAPGQNILTINHLDVSSLVNGTSFACPIVAGCCALLKSMNKNYTHNEIKDIIQRSAGNRTNTYENDFRGFGLLNIRAALEPLITPTPTTTQDLTRTPTPTPTATVTYTPSVTPTNFSSLNQCDYLDNTCFSKWLPYSCGCVFGPESFTITGSTSGSSWTACAITYNGAIGHTNCIGNDCLFQVVRGQNSLLYPGSPIADWIIGEQVSIVAAVGSVNLNTIAYVCGKTKNTGMGGIYDVLILRCTNINIPTPTPTPTITSTKSVISGCDRSAISVCLPGSILRANPNATNICFRVGGTSCCNIGGEPLYSNEVCVPIPPLPPLPPVLDPPCVPTANQGPYTIEVAYESVITPGSIPCGQGAHSCDRTIFDVMVNGTKIGQANLNNSASGGSRSSRVAVPSNLISGSSFTFELRCAGSNCHNGIAIVRILDNTNTVFYQSCLANDRVFVLPNCTPTPTPTPSPTPASSIPSCGNAWQTSSLSTSSNEWRSLAYGNGRYMAVGSFVANTSNNGSIWSPSTIDNRRWLDVVYASGQFLAVGDNDILGRTTNGSTWTTAQIGGPSTPPPDGMTSWAGGNYISIAYNATNDTVAALGLYSVAGSLPNNCLVVATSSSPYTSWTSRIVYYSPASGPVRVEYDNINKPKIYFHDGHFVVTFGLIGNSSIPLGNMMTTTDPSIPLSWTYRNSLNWPSSIVGFTSSGTDLQAGMKVAITQTTISRSNDFLTWTTSPLPNDYIWNGIAYGNNNLVIISQSNNIIGINSDIASNNWYLCSLANPPAILRDIIYGNNTFMIIAESGFVSTGPNLII